MKANNKNLPHSNNQNRSLEAIHRTKKASASIVKMAALLALLLTATESNAQKQQPKRTASKRDAVTSQKDSVGSIKTSKTVAELLDTANNPLAQYGYPFTLKIFDANDLTFSDFVFIKSFSELIIYDVVLI